MRHRICISFVFSLVLSQQLDNVRSHQFSGGGVGGWGSRLQRRRFTATAAAATAAAMATTTTTTLMSGVGLLSTVRISFVVVAFVLFRIHTEALLQPRHNLNLFTSLGRRVRSVVIERASIIHQPYQRLKTSAVRTIPIPRSPHARFRIPGSTIRACPLEQLHVVAVQVEFETRISHFSFKG
jgi:hypothetical protein